jgi:pyridoxal phosphate enzyme (YggS family)
MTIADNVRAVQDRIADACAKVGRNPDEITLVAVSKRKPVDAVIEALQAGVQHFGENRVEESVVKLPAVAAQLGELPEPIWHFVGHVQSRKTKEVLPLFPVIHSLDSVKLAQKVSRMVTENGQHAPQLYVQVNVSGEKQKYGFPANGWEKNPQIRDTFIEQLRQILVLEGLDVRGFMTMAPYGAPEAELREVFTSLAALKAESESQLKVHLPDLSMGMTDDYPIAIEEGATVVRVGRALFGEREY